MINIVKALLKKILFRETPHPISLSFGASGDRKKFDSAHIRNDFFLEKGYSAVFKDPVIEGQEHGYYFPDLHLYELQDVGFEPSTGLVWLGSHPVRESSPFGSVLSVKHQNIPRFSERNRLSGQLYSGINSTSYFHWLIEELPKAIRIQKIYPEVIFIVAEEHERDYILQTLEAYKLKYVLKSEPVLVEKFILINSSLTGWGRNTDLAMLSEQITKIERQSQNQQKIYVSRRHSSRGMKNEKAFEDALSFRGFEVLMLENMEWKNQVSKFHSASVVVAPHGAGLSNLVYCQTGTKVLEIFRNDFVNSCFQVIANQRNLSYDSFILDSDSTMSTMSTHDFSRLLEIIDLIE